MTALLLQEINEGKSTVTGNWIPAHWHTATVVLILNTGYRLQTLNYRLTILVYRHQGSFRTSSK